MKIQTLFSSKDKSKKLKCRLLQFMHGALRLTIVFDQNSEVVPPKHIFLDLATAEIAQAWKSLHIDVWNITAPNKPVYLGKCDQCLHP